MAERVEENKGQYLTWKRVYIRDGKKEINLVSIEITTVEFSERNVRKHNRLVNDKYTEIRRFMSKNLFLYVMEEGLQSTIHPVVCYYMTNSKLAHNCIYFSCFYKS